LPSISPDSHSTEHASCGPLDIASTFDVYIGRNTPTDITSGTTISIHTDRQTDGWTRQTDRRYSVRNGVI
jgi:hypothetical protein